MQLRAGVEQIALEPERGGNLARLIRHDADGGINPFLEDLLRRFGGDFLDVHAAFGAGHDERARVGAVEQHGEVKFLFDASRRGDEQLAARSRPSGPVCLVTSTWPSICFGERRRLRRHDRSELHAALKAALERAFAASAGVDLRFDDHLRAAGGEDLAPPPGGLRRATCAGISSGTATPYCASNCLA